MGGPIAHFSRVVPTSWGVIRRLAYHVDYGINNVKLALAELGGNTAIVGEAAVQWVTLSQTRLEMVDLGTIAKLLADNPMQGTRTTAKAAELGGLGAFTARVATLVPGSVGRLPQPAPWHGVCDGKGHANWAPQWLLPWRFAPKPFAFPSQCTGSWVAAWGAITPGSATSSPLPSWWGYQVSGTTGKLETMVTGRAIHGRQARRSLARHRWAWTPPRLRHFGGVSTRASFRCRPH